MDGHRISGLLPAEHPQPGRQRGKADHRPTHEQHRGRRGRTPSASLAKAILLIAGSVLAGGLAFLAFVTPRPPAADAPSETGEDEKTFAPIAVKVVAIALAVLVVAGGVELLLQATDIDAGVADVFRTRWGERWLLRNLVLIQPALALLVFGRSAAYRRAAAAAALFGAAAYLGDHVQRQPRGGRRRLVLGTALRTSSTCWRRRCGSACWRMLVLYFRWARRAFGEDERYLVLADALRRFSIIAVFSVALLLFTGVINTVIEVGRLGDLFDTGYGLSLLAKLLLLMPLLAIGARNAYLLRPQLVQESGERQMKSRQEFLAELEADLNVTIRWELGVALAVLVVVGLTGADSRRRADASRTPDKDSGPFVRTSNIENLFVTLRIDPNQPGDEHLRGLPGRRYANRREPATRVRAAGWLRLDRAAAAGRQQPADVLPGAGSLPHRSPASGPSRLNIRRNTGFDLRVDFRDDVEDTTPVAAGARLGGSYDSPIKFTMAVTALLALSALGTGVLVIGSLPVKRYPDGMLAWAVRGDRLSSAAATHEAADLAGSARCVRHRAGDHRGQPSAQTAVAGRGDSGQPGRVDAGVDRHTAGCYS